MFADTGAIRKLWAGYVCLNGGRANGSWDGRGGQCCSIGVWMRERVSGGMVVTAT